MTDPAKPSTAKHWSRAHGLTICSDIDLPEVAQSGAGTRPDITVTLSPGIADATVVRSVDLGANVTLARLSNGADRLAIPGVGSFSVNGGREIRVGPKSDCDPGLLALYVLGSAMGLALMQRGALVLHGAGVVVEGHAVLVLGKSGAGKSTLAANLAETGLDVLGDDTLALWPDETSGFKVWPAAQSFKLWSDAVERIGRETDALPQVADRLTKFYISNPNRASDQPYPLGGIFILETVGAECPVRTVELDPLTAIRDLDGNVYRPEFIEPLGISARSFQQVCACADLVPIRRLERPWGVAHLPDVKAAMLQSIQRDAAKTS